MPDNDKCRKPRPRRLPSRSLAQAHVNDTGDYVLRASTVSAARLQEGSLEKYGIPTSPNTAVLNVLVQRRTQDALRNVKAEVNMAARNLGGIATNVQMREVVANGQVTYLGVYSFLPREVMDFSISARPEGEEQVISLAFRDRLARE